MMGELITLRQAAARPDLFNNTVAVSTLFDWRNRGLIDWTFRLNGRVVCYAQDVRDWIAAQREAAS